MGRAGDFEHPHAGCVHAHLGVDRAIGQAERGDRLSSGFDNCRLDRFRLARRRDVDGLLEEGTIERIGLVEYRDDVETPAAERNVFHRG
jgi:hypothetical protein